MALTSVQLKTLATCPLFHGLTEQEISYIPPIQAGNISHYQKGETVYQPDSFSNALGILLAGQVRVTKENENLVVSTLTPGALFGAAALFTSENRYVSSLTARTACDVLFLSEVQVTALLADTRIALSYIRYLTGRVRFLSDKVDMLVQSSGYDKLLRYLTAKADQDGIVRTECSLSELAARLHMSRAALYREMDKLEQMQRLRRNGRTLQLIK